jgi:reticulon-4-interacting protein 1, mitochondrial
MLNVLADSVEIRRPSDEVFAYICNMENYVEWFPYILRMRAVDDFPIGTIGKKYDEIALLPNGKEEAITVRVVDYKENSSLAIEADLEPAQPRFDYRVESINATTTRFHWQCRARNTSLKARVFVPLMHIVLGARLKHALVNLKARLERSTAQSMHAWVTHRFGEANDVLRQAKMYPRPAPAKNEILVRVRATSINQIDVKRRAGYGRNLLKLKKAVAFPMVVGNDFAGDVVAVGAGVTRWRVGDRVFGAKDHSTSGTQAEYVAVPHVCASAIPEGWSYVDAAVQPYAFLTAYSALTNDAKLNSTNAQDKKIFIQGGGGAVGLAALQLCKVWGAHVAVSCAKRSIATVQAAGGDVVIDYTTEDYAEKLRDYDVAFCCATLEEESRMLQILKRNAGATFVSVVHPILANTDRAGVLRGLIASSKDKKSRIKRAKKAGIGYAWSLMKHDPAVIELLQTLMANRQVKAFVGKVYAFDEMPAAQHAVEAGHIVGKVVVEMSQTSA